MTGGTGKKTIGGGSKIGSAANRSQSAVKSVRPVQSI